MRILGLLGVVVCVSGSPAWAQAIDFGDDSGDWSNDGECDDPRFEGPGMAGTPLLDEDIRADATDCQSAFFSGSVTLRGTGSAGAGLAEVDFGDDSSDWSNDGECDDPRFEGVGMTVTPLLDEDIRADATDCRNAFNAGLIALAGSAAAAAGPDLIVDGVNFGNDLGDWSNDNECDDPRFEGSGMTTTPLLSGDVLRDATDCATAFQAGNLTLRGVNSKGTIDFGDDAGDWSNDGECDDMRFAGPGMTTTPLLFEDIQHDATDCKTAFDAGLLALVGQ